MQSIVNIATAKNTVKPVAEQPPAPAKKRARMVYLRAYDPVAFPVNAKELFDALGLRARRSVVTILKERGFMHDRDFVTVSHDGLHSETYLTIRAARSVCERRRVKTIGASVAERVEGFARKTNTNAGLAPIIEDVRRCVESLRNENDSLKKQLADAKNRVAALESNSNESVAEALMRIITGAA